MQANFESPSASAGAVTLDNCDSEPIHIPGHIQPHGALFAFDAQGRLTHRSRNATEVLGAGLPGLGETLGSPHFADVKGFHQLVTRGAEKPEEVIPDTMLVQTPLGTFDLVVHRTPSALICEFEHHLGLVPLPYDLVAVAHRALERLKRQKTVDTLLEVAVQALRSLTGFDRVMAYRFRHDDSGEVVAESVVPALDPFLGQRYPAGDIPQQARRLYILNTLRLIADVGAVRVAVEPASNAVAPLDMSYCLLRSVSPIHLEYLGNMGVSASMSVSIVIGGKLWGMLACHHRTPWRVAYAVRMACDTLAQVLASHLQGALAIERAARSDGYASMRARLVDAVRSEADVVLALAHEAAALTEAFAAHAVVVALGEKLQVHGDVTQAMAGSLVQWLNRDRAADEAARDMLLLDNLQMAPAALQDTLAGWAGVLAVPFGDEPPSWVVLLRKEEIETIRWGGKPEKVYKQGPSGPRLTPRGSFELWKEIVRGKAVPWSETERDSAQKLRDDLMRADAIHTAQRGKARGELLAMLGSDLRYPLQTILDTAIELRASGMDASLGDRLHRTGARMQRLVSEALDISRMQPGAVMHLQTRPTDLAALVRQLLTEATDTHPGMKVQPLLPQHLWAEVDPERIAQAIRHLLSNAGQHGLDTEPVLVELRDLDGTAVIEVSNEGHAIAAATTRGMFMPFQPLPMRAGVREKRVGVGLYIAHQIIENHGGSLSYTFADPYVVFSIVLPLGLGDSSADSAADKTNAPARPQPRAC